MVEAESCKQTSRQNRDVQVLPVVDPAVRSMRVDARKFSSAAFASVCACGSRPWNAQARIMLLHASLSPTCATSDNSASTGGSERVLKQPTVEPTSARSARARNSDLRVRQHVNPLATYYQQPIALENDWYAKAFDDLERPLVIDVGVARGRWVKKMAAKHPNLNFIGLEIRASLVAAANAVRDRDGLRNLHYIYCNANVSFHDIVMSTMGNKNDMLSSNIELVCFQFCDPWFKSRHAKRRLVQEPLVQQVYGTLRATKGRCYVSSDVLDLAIEMRERFDACDGLQRDERLSWSDDGWLCENPFPVLSEREIAVLSASPEAPIYRAMFRVK